MPKHDTWLEVLTLPLWQPERFQLVTFCSPIFLPPYLLRRRRLQRHRKFLLSLLSTVAVKHSGKPPMFDIMIIGNCEFWATTFLFRTLSSQKSGASHTSQLALLHFLLATTFSPHLCIPVKLPALALFSFKIKVIGSFETSEKLTHQSSVAS
jgi:hypothetical protein